MSAILILRSCERIDELATGPQVAWEIQIELFSYISLMSALRRRTLGLGPLPQMYVVLPTGLMFIYFAFHVAKIRSCNDGLWTLTQFKQPEAIGISALKPIARSAT